MKVTAKLFTGLLPALQHMARFPTAKLEAVCGRHGWPAAEVRTAIEAMVGEVPRWEEETLAEFAGKLGVAVPPYMPAPIAPRAFAGDHPPAGGRCRAAAAEDDLDVRSFRASLRAPAPVRKVLAETVSRATVEASPAPRLTEGPLPAFVVRPWERMKRVWPRTLNTYWPVLERLAANPEADAASEIASAGLRWSGWRKWRELWLGNLALDSALLRELQAWAVAEIGRDKLSPLVLCWDGAPVPSLTSPAPAKAESPAGAPGDPKAGVRLEPSRPARVPHGAITMLPTSAVDDLLIELVDLAKAYGRARKRGGPCAILRRTLIGVCQEVCELTLPGGAEAAG